jgi:hypothetical protein
MDDPRLPIPLREDCAALALPFCEVKPVYGLKNMRDAAAWLDDDDGDPIGEALRGNITPIRKDGPC